MISPANVNVTQQISNEDEQFWQSHFKQFTNINTTRKAYCREHQLNYDRFQYWYNKLIRKKNMTKKKPLAISPFIPVSLKPETPSLTPLCCIELASGARLTIHDMKVVHHILSGIL